MTQGNSRGQISQTTTEDFPLFFRLLDWNSEEYEAQSCPRFNSEHIHVNLRVNLTMLNSDFTGVILKSVRTYLHLRLSMKPTCSVFTLEFLNYLNHKHQPILTSDILPDRRVRGDSSCLDPSRRPSCRSEPLPRLGNWGHLNWPFVVYDRPTVARTVL